MYLRPTDSAASFGSTIVCTSAADSNKVFLYTPKLNSFDGSEFPKALKVQAGALRSRTLKNRMPISRAKLIAFARMMTMSDFKHPYHHPQRHSGGERQERLHGEIASGASFPILLQLR
ncbi:MAG TPA: hypothetical protein VGI22_02455 [Xanthobacteraceae bacterium]|jgi:hypothetical protein